MKVEGSTFLVTGGSSGLGLAASEELFMRGANIVIADLLHAELAHFQGKSHHTNNRIVYSKTSVTEPESIQDTVGLAFREFGVLHGVINCAGIGAIVKTVAKKKFGALENARRVIEINLLGTYNVVSIAASAMSAQAANADGERGVFINTASVAAFDGQIGQAPYSASKGGVVSMTLPLAREMAAHGFRVMAIAPGVFETPMTARLPAKAREELNASILLPKRLGLPAEFAQLVVQIIENPYLNGSVIRLDGGVRMV